MDESGHLLCIVPLNEPKEVLDRIRRRFPRLKITYTTSKPTGSGDGDQGKDRQKELWNDVTVLCTLTSFPSDPSLAPKLELVHVISAGVNHLWDTPIYKDSDVPITSSSGIHGPTIAEWAIMSSLVASRKYNILREWQLQHSWGGAKGDKDRFHTVSTNVGKRLGVLGYGSIGRQVARLAKALGMEIFVFTLSQRDTPERRKDHGYVIPHTGDPEGEFPSAWYSGSDKASLHHFLGQDLDQLLVSVPLTNTTRRMLGREEFAILAKKNAFIINVARGEILDQDALIEALELFEKDESANIDEGRRGLSGAALDVTTPEPLVKEHPLWDAPNCIISPHISGASQGYAQRALEVLEVNLERRSKGLDLINVVNRELGYASNARETRERI